MFFHNVITDLLFVGFWDIIQQTRNDWKKAGIFRKWATVQPEHVIVFGEEIGRVGEPLPYWIHPEEVADKTAYYGGDVGQILAALYHDHIEDLGDHWRNRIKDLHGENVADLVWELTNVYTKEAYPALNRYTRQKKEAERLANVSSRAKLVKLADILANSVDIAFQNPAFARKYIPEQRQKVELIMSTGDLTPRHEELALKILDVEF